MGGMLKRSSVRETGLPATLFAVSSETSEYVETVEPTYSLAPVDDEPTLIYESLGTGDPLIGGGEPLAMPPVGGGDGGGDGGTDPSGLTDIIVTGRPFDWMMSSMFLNDLSSYQDFFYDDGLANSGFDPGEDSTPTPDNPGNGMGSDEAENAILYLDGISASLTEALEKYGPGTMADVDGKLIPVHDILLGIGKVVDLIAAGNLVIGLETGDQTVSDAVQFVFGVVVGAAALEAGAGLLAAAAIAVVAEEALELGFAGLSVVYNEVTEQIDTAITGYVQDNPAEPTNDPYEFFRSIMGMPSYKTESLDYIYQEQFP